MWIQPSGQKIFLGGKSWYIFYWLFVLRSFMCTKLIVLKNVAPKQQRRSHHRDGGEIPKVRLLNKKKSTSKGVSQK